MVKSVAELVREANAATGTITVDQAKELLGRDDVVFVDVREPRELEAQGRIPGAVHVPRALLEFAADPEGRAHRPELASGKQLVLYCGSGVRSALAARTLKDMGIDRVTNLLGGFSGWQQGGGPIER